MAAAVPHFLPYQGSKRRLAPQILDLVPRRHFARLIEPFAGSGAITLAAAQRGLCDHYLLGDSLLPLAALWRRALNDPGGLADAYASIWQQGDFSAARAAFNETGDEAALLYLLARCVKNAPRFNQMGAFNQSADRRRRGVDPQRLRRSLAEVAHLLGGRCEVHGGDFCELLALAGPEDLVYLDPPYQGTSEGVDRRYHQGLARERLVDALADLQRRRIPLILSYDGQCGARSYGAPLPESLGLQHLQVEAGRSSQATLSGRAEMTVESLYVSPGLADQGGDQLRNMRSMRAR